MRTGEVKRRNNEKNRALGKIIEREIDRASCEGHIEIQTFIGMDTSYFNRAVMAELQKQSPLAKVTSISDLQQSTSLSDSARLQIVSSLGDPSKKPPGLPLGQERHFYYKTANSIVSIAYEKKRTAMGSSLNEFVVGIENNRTPSSGVQFYVINDNGKIISKYSLSPSSTGATVSPLSFDITRSDIANVDRALLAAKSSTEKRV